MTIRQAIESAIEGLEEKRGALDLRSALWELEHYYPDTPHALLDQGAPLDRPISNEAYRESKVHVILTLARDRFPG